MARETPTSTPCPIFVAYADIPAARHAMSRVKDVLPHSLNCCHLQPMLWRFDQLADQRWRDMALRDACRASVVVLAMSDADGLTAQADAWLTALAAGQRGARITALLFVGEDEPWTISLQQTRPAPAANAVTAKAAGGFTLIDANQSRHSKPEARAISEYAA